MSLHRIAVQVALFLAATTALAGAPLKGIDIKLGKNPGGGPFAYRVTNAQGVASFGVLTQGAYDLTFTPPSIGPTPIPTANPTSVEAERAVFPLAVRPVAPTLLHVIIDGAVGGRVQRDVSVSASDTLRQTPVTVEVSGQTELNVTVLGQ